MTYYIGQQPDQLLGDTPRYFYGLRRTDDGELYFVRIDQLLNQEPVEINKPGAIEGNFSEFEVGVDFFEGRNVYHNLIHENLNYEQYRWSDTSVYYYIDDDGQLVARTLAKYQYPTGI